MVLGTAVLLVFGIARLLGTGSDASSPPPQKQAVQAAATSSATTAPPPPGVTRTTEPKRAKASKTPEEPVLATPSGPCLDEDIAVTPEVEKAEAGSRVRIVVGLRTINAEACTWRVSPESLTIKITSGDDDIWSSRECPKAVPTADVVVRRAVTKNVSIYWSARRSDDECSRQTTWALPGWYHVAVAAFAGEPSDLQFELTRPEPKVVTQTVPPQGGKNGGKNQGNDQPKHR
jgi:hypothetical protein